MVFGVQYLMMNVIRRCSARTVRIGLVFSNVAQDFQYRHKIFSVFHGNQPLNVPKYGNLGSLNVYVFNYVEENPAPPYCIVETLLFASWTEWLAREAGNIEIHKGCG